MFSCFFLVKDTVEGEASSADKVHGEYEAVRVFGTKDRFFMQLDLSSVVLCPQPKPSHACFMLEGGGT